MLLKNIDDLIKDDTSRNLSKVIEENVIEHCWYYIRRMT